MKISIIAAVAQNKVIGVDNRLPWHLPEDLKNFKRLTWGKPILMGRKTFDSLGRVLPGRTNVVISRNPDFQPDGCKVFQDIDTALAHFTDQDEIMVIGGASFYRQLLPKAQTLYLTFIDRDFAGDIYFPDFDYSEWEERSKRDFVQEKEPFLAYSFRVYDRKPVL